MSVVAQGPAMVGPNNVAPPSAGTADKAPQPHTHHRKKKTPVKPSNDVPGDGEHDVPPAAPTEATPVVSATSVPVSAVKPPPAPAPPVAAATTPTNAPASDAPVASVADAPVVSVADDVRSALAEILARLERLGPSPVELRPQGAEDNLHKTVDDLIRRVAKLESEISAK
jgi:hypothetical protein